MRSSHPKEGGSLASCPSALCLLFILASTSWPHALVAQAPKVDPAKALAKVEAHVRKINELGRKLKNRMKAGFPPVQNRQEALDIVEDTFRDIVQFKSHYNMAKRRAKLTEGREERRMWVRGMKNAYFPGDFFDYFPLIEKLQKHVKRFQVQVNALEWYARYKNEVEADMALLEQKFEANLGNPATNPHGIPIWEAVERKLVETAVAGDGRVTSRLKLMIRNRTEKKVRVSIPVWTAAIPPDSGRQIMLIREPRSVSIAPGNSKTVDCPCVCADLRTKQRPAQKFSTYRFGAHPSVRDQAAVQNIIGIVDLIEVKGRYATLGIPDEIRAHMITQLCIWRHLARARKSGPADITRETVRQEMALQLGKHADQLSRGETKAIIQRSPEILRKVDEALAKLDI